MTCCPSWPSILRTAAPIPAPCPSCDQDFHGGSGRYWPPLLPLPSLSLVTALAFAHTFTQAEPYGLIVFSACATDVAVRSGDPGPAHRPLPARIFVAAIRCFPSLPTKRPLLFAACSSFAGSHRRSSEGRPAGISRADLRIPSCDF